MRTATQPRLGAGRTACAAVACAAMTFVAANGARADVERATGATVYLPVYSQASQGSTAPPFQLVVTATVRNTDPDSSITLVRVDYHGPDGKRIHGHAPEPLQIGPLASREFHARKSDLKLGAGGSFIVEWKATSEVNMPIVEALMIGTHAGQGISFTSRGQIVE